MNTENETCKSDKKPSPNTRRRSRQRSSQVLRRKQNKSKTASEECLSSSEKSGATANVTVLTPPPAMSVKRTVSPREPCNRTLTSGSSAITQNTAATTCKQMPLMPKMIVSHSTGDKAGTSLHCDNNDAVKQQCDNDIRAADVIVDNRAVLPAKPDLGLQLTEADNVKPLCTETSADESLAPNDARDDADVIISDDSLHLSTQMLCAIAGPEAGDVNIVRDILPPATVLMTSSTVVTTSSTVVMTSSTVVTMSSTDSHKLLSENIFDTSLELDGLALTSATCQFMKEFSTQKFTVQTDTEEMRDHEVGAECRVVAPVETVLSPRAPQPDLSVSNTSELVAASNFDRICTAGDNEVNRQIAYSEEMVFDDADQCVQVIDNLPVADKLKDRLSPGLSNGITSDLAAKLAMDDGIDNKSDLFASYIEEPEIAVRREVCWTIADPPEQVAVRGEVCWTKADPLAENSFNLDPDSLTSTMLDRAMAVVNQATVSSQSEAVNHPLVSAADAKPSSDADAEFIVDSDMRNPQSEPPDVDIEAALHLLCENSQKSTKKPPKRRGRKRNSDSADPFRKSGTGDIEEKRCRTLSHSPQLVAEAERADACLNEAVCGLTSFSISFGSTSDSSAYVPPTPPSTAADKSNVNTPRRLLGGLAGVTPVKYDHSEHQVGEVKKNISRCKGCKDKELTQYKPNGYAEPAQSGCEVKHDGTSPAVSQGLQSTQSFTIIDVASDQQLFNTFIAEWQRQQSFSLSLACEKRSKPRAQHSRRSTQGIGHKFAPGNEIDELIFQQLT